MNEKGSKIATHWELSQSAKLNEEDCQPCQWQFLSISDGQLKPEQPDTNPSNTAPEKPRCLMGLYKDLAGRLKTHNHAYFRELISANKSQYVQKRPSNHSAKSPRNFLSCELSFESIRELSLVILSSEFIEERRI